jgi:cytochrome c oxidase subunit 3
MTTLDAFNKGARAGDRPYHETYEQAPHFRSKAEEFDANKLGMWLFLTTELLLFAGLFCAYAVFRMLYPEAFANGSHYLDWKWGCLNTVVLLFSSWTMAMCIRNAQKNQQGWLKINLAVTWFCALAFIVIKLTFEYAPKLTGYFFVLDPALPHYLSPEEMAHGKTAVLGLFHFVEGYGGKAPGVLFSYPFSDDPSEPIWWGVYYGATAIHATHVLIGMGLIGWLFWRACKRHFGPTHYTAVELTGLYWHIVDLIWIFLFPLLYLIH